MKKFFSLLMVVLPLWGLAQSNTEKEEVIAVIERFFDGMRAGDSSAIRAVIHPSIRLQTTLIDQEGNPQLRRGNMERFMAQVGTPRDEVLDEKIWSYHVLIDGRLASVWTDYTFYIGERLSHCGVNAFQLFNGPDGWRIFQIADTRRREDCQTGSKD